MKDGAERYRLRTIEQTEEDLLLTVFPPDEGEQPITINELLLEFEARKIIGYDDKLLRSTVREMRGVPERVAPVQESLLAGPVVNIELSKNKMEAYLTLFAALDGTPVTRQQIDEAFEEKGITYGLCEEFIQVALRRQYTPQPYLVAQGLEAVNGTNATIDYKCLPSSRQGKPVELEDGKVDFHNLNLIRNVQMGEILAIKSPATEGTLGYTVTGNELPPKPGKDIRLAAGKNIQLINDEHIAVATMPGHAVVVGNKVSVSPVYEVKGDVDLNTGNINFNGNVLVRGSVTEGFSVKAEGDVEIDNLVAGGHVECGGNIKIKNGIVGQKVSVIRAEGSVFTKFIENATVESGMDIFVGEAIMHSDVGSKKDINVGGKGVVIGGLIRAGGDIRCKRAGSHSATVELEAGVNPEIRAEYARLLVERQEKEAQYQKADQAVQVLNKMKASGTPMHSDKLALLVQVTKLQTRSAEELGILNKQISAIEERMKALDSGRIWIQEKIFSGVKVTIGMNSRYMQDDVQFACLAIDEGEIKILSYK